MNLPGGLRESFTNEVALHIGLKDKKFQARQAKKEDSFWREQNTQTQEATRSVMELQVASWLFLEQKEPTGVGGSGRKGKRETERDEGGQ